jgi:signal transduction histidine kinase
MAREPSAGHTAGMAGRRWSALALTLFATTVLVELVAISLSVGLEPAWDTWIYALYALTYAAAGALVAHRHPRNAVGWLLLATGVINAFVSDLAQGYGLRAAAEGWPHGPLFEWISYANWTIGGALLAMTFLVFPDGHLASRRSRVVIAVVALGVGLSVPGYGLDPRSGELFVSGTNPYAVTWLPTRAIYAAGLSLFSLGLLLAVVALLVRLARASGEERQQLKLFVHVNAVAVVVLLVDAALWFTYPVTHVISAITLLAMPVAAGVAILRHRLYDIDLAINRTLVYGSLTLVLGLAYAAVSILLGTSLGRGSAWVTAGATLAVALAFRPVRARIQDAVDHRFDRHRWDAAHRMDAFLERLREGVAEPEDVVPLLRTLVGDESIELTGRAPDVRHGALSAEQDSLLGLLLERGALAVEMVGLRAELREQLVEVEASRARIVEAGDRERRRMERDLHDGAQQRLVSIGLSLRHAQHQLATGTGSTQGVNRTLEASIAEIAATIDELRQLTHGLPPSQLDAGLAPAFHELARRSPVRVEVSAPAERFDRGLEAAAYFVGCEGLTNAVKHAGATRIDLLARRRNGSLVVEVNDDGAGGADPASGSGLRGLADRVSALGGTLTIASPPGRGTQLTVELPCGS